VKVATKEGVARCQACLSCTPTVQKILVMVRQTSCSPRTIGCAAAFLTSGFVLKGFSVADQAR
jgi:hypothetical protein